MKKMWGILWVCVVFGAFFQGFWGLSQWRSLSWKISELEGRIRCVNDQERRLSGFKSIVPVKLDAAYIGFIDDMRSIALAYGLGISIDGGLPLFVSSSLVGLNQAKLKVVFSHISSRGALVSMLSALDARSCSGSFLVERMTQERDSLVIEAVLFGV